MDPVAVDLAPLRRTARLRDILAYERIVRIPPWRRLVVVMLWVLLLAAAMLAALAWLRDSGVLAAVPIAGAFAAAYGVLAAFGFVWFAVDLGRRTKIAAFAWANGWTYADVLEHTGRQGAPFTRVLRGRERAVVAGDDLRMPFELGRHSSVSRGQERATVQRPFAFVELPLPAAVPHMILRNRRRSVIPTLGLGRGNARMDLEGDFASHFTLFVPEGYERDALYVFTPDLMARVVDLGGGAEMELIGRRLYLYLPHRTRFDRAETMAMVLTVAEELHRRFVARTERYRDEAAGALAARAGAGIALRGQRLAGGGISVLAVVGTAAVVLLSAAVTALTLFAGDLFAAVGG